MQDWIITYKTNNGTIGKLMVPGIDEATSKFLAIRFLNCKESDIIYIKKAAATKNFSRDKRYGRGN